MLMARRRARRSTSSYGDGVPPVAAGVGVDVAGSDLGIAFVRSSQISGISEGFGMSHDKPSLLQSRIYSDNSLFLV
jgi:hypothetical protein